jgi:hypothetical protein
MVTFVRKLKYRVLSLVIVAQLTADEGSGRIYGRLIMGAFP